MATPLGGVLSSFDTDAWSGASGAEVFGALAAGGVNSEQKLIKRITGIADNVATAVLTVTVPNAAHSAGISLEGIAIGGAGGAIGAHESMTMIRSAFVAVTRTSGLDTAKSPSNVDQGGATVAGGNSVTITNLTLSALTGADSETQTFTINITIQSFSTLTNHILLLAARCINANAAGVTIA